MTPCELANKLKSMYENAPDGESTTMIHLFGVLYADELEGYSVAELKQLAIEAIGKSGAAGSRSPGYGGEIRKTIKLSRYVQVKNCYRDEFK